MTIEQMHGHDPHPLPPSLPQAINTLQQALRKDGVPSDLGLLYVFSALMPFMSPEERRAAVTWMDTKVQQWERPTPPPERLKDG